MLKSDLGNKQVFSSNLKKLMELKNINQTEICKDLGLPFTTFNAWYTGYAYPRIDKIELLANYFGVLKSDLIENKTEETLTLKNELIKMLEEKYETMTDEDKKQLIDFADYLLAKKK